MSNPLFSIKLDSYGQKVKEKENLALVLTVNFAEFFRPSFFIENFRATESLLA